MKFLSADDAWHYQSKKEFWSAVAGAVVSMYQGKKAENRMDQAAAEAGATRDERLAIAQENYNKWKEDFGPIEQDLIDSVDQFTVRDNLAKYMEQATTDVASAHQKSQGMQERQMARYGLDPSDRRYQESGRELGIERARMEVGARAKARTKAEEERIADEDKLFSRRLATAKFGRTGSEPQRQLSAAYGNDLSYMQAQEEGYAKQASEGYGLAGGFLEKAISSFNPSSSASTDGYSSAPDYSDGTMTDNYGSFSSGDLGW